MVELWHATPLLWILSDSLEKRNNRNLLCNSWVNRSALFFQQTRWNKFKVPTQFVKISKLNRSAGESNPFCHPKYRGQFRHLKHKCLHDFGDGGNRKHLDLVTITQWRGWITSSYVGRELCLWCPSKKKNCVFDV